MIISPYKIKKNYRKFRNFDKNKLFRIYEKLFLNRTSEEIIQKNYSKGIFKTPTHLGIGQEAIAVGVCMNLKKNDYVYCHHRSHLPYISLDGDLYSFFCELMGKNQGSSGGKGGSVHLNINKNIKYASLAILGEPLGLAVGSGLAFKLKKKKNISCVFFGNASLEEGIAYETLSFSSLKKIPTLFIFENNFYSTEMKYNNNYAKKINYKKMLESMNISYLKIDGNNISETYFAAKKCIENIRKYSKPLFIEFLTYRWLEHCGPNYDFEVGREYRSKKEINYWKQACPVLNFREFLINKFNLEDILRIENKTIKYVIKCFSAAQNSKFPSDQSINTNV